MLRVDHPFICNLEYQFKNDKNMYFIMPYVSGGELTQFVNNNGVSWLQDERHQESQKSLNANLDEKSVQFIAAQLVVAIGHLHEHNIVHCDLKPANILFEPNGYLKVIDFGTAEQIIPGRQSYSDGGSPAYNAPEIFLKTGSHKDVDWWALGIILYELLFGKRPFEGIGQELKSKVIGTDLRFPTDKKYSEQTQDLIKKLLVKD